MPPKLLHSWDLKDIRYITCKTKFALVFNKGNLFFSGDMVQWKVEDFALKVDQDAEWVKGFIFCGWTQVRICKKHSTLLLKIGSKASGNPFTNVSTVTRVPSLSIYTHFLASNNGSFSSHLDSVGMGISSANSVLSVAPSNAGQQAADLTSLRSSRLSRVPVNGGGDSGSDVNSSGAESTAALLGAGQHRSQSRDDIKGQRQPSRSLSRCRNPSLNWSSNESSVETMSIALSEVNDHQVLHGSGNLPSPDHLVNRKDLLEKMGINPGSSHQNSRNHKPGEFAPQWSMDLGKPTDTGSISSHEETGSCQLTASTSGVRGNGVGLTPPLTPKTTGSAAAKTAQKRMLAAAPCPCDHAQSTSGLGLSADATADVSDPPSFENYDIPRQQHLSKQVTSLNKCQCHSRSTFVV